MVEAYKEAIVGKTSIYRVDAPFDEALKVLGKPMSMSQLAGARMQVSKEHSLNTNGSYTRKGFVYVKNAEPIIRGESFLLDSSLAGKAVEANRAGKYFTTNSKELYEKARAEAEKDKNISPTNRRAIILPSRKNFIISPQENPEVFEFLLGKDSKYLAHAGRDNLNMYLVDPSVVDAQAGTLLTQLWFRGLGGDSGVVGGYGSLGCGVRVRGVRAPVGASKVREATQKISDNTKLPYTPKQLDKLYKLAEGVREGKLPNSKLEALTKFIEDLRNK